MTIMTILQETSHTAEFLLNEGNGHISREQITIASGQKLESGTVLGQITTGASATAAAAADNTGNGEVGAITLGSGAKKGNYTLIIIEPTAGAFQVEAPDGKVVGTGNVGAVFSKGGLSFTLAAGSTNFVADDTITITVADGSGKWTACNANATDGSQVAAGVLYAAVDATGADAQAVAIVRQAEVIKARLIGCDAAAKAALAARAIIVR